jgi:hypothetical protein
VTGKELKLSLGLSFEVIEEDDPDDCHACVHVELDFKNQKKFLINLLYDPAAQGWSVQQIEGLDHYATIEKKFLAMAQQPYIENGEAFTLILLMVDIFLNESAEEN